MNLTTKKTDGIKKTVMIAAHVPLLVALMALALTGPTPVYAEGQGSTDTPNTGGASTVTPFQTYSIEPPMNATAPEIIGRFVNMIIGVTGSVALVMFAYGGFTWLTSRGNPEQVQKGKNIFIWATIGLVIIFSSYMILTNIFKVMGATD